MDNTTISLDIQLEKVKKQAKRLFQVAKTQELSVTIKNLAQAQEILAQINGYPNWYSLEKTISGQFKDSTQEPQNIIAQKKSWTALKEYKSPFGSKEQIVNDPLVAIRERNKFVYEGESAYFFIQFNRFSFASSIEALYEWITDISTKFTHLVFSELFDIKVIVENEKTKIHNAFIDWCNLPPQMLKDFLIEDIQQALELKIIISIKCPITELELLENFKIGLINVEGVNYTILPKLSIKQKAIFNGESLDGFNKYLAPKDITWFKTPSFRYFLTWLDFLSQLITTTEEWYICMDYLDEKLEVYYVNDKITIDKSLQEAETLIHDESMSKYSSSAFKNLPWHQGMRFLTDDNYPLYYAPSSTEQTTWITLIEGQERRQLFTQNISLYSILNNAFSITPCYIQVGDCAAFYSGLKEILPTSFHHDIQYVDMTTPINIFETQLGFKKLPYGQIPLVEAILSKIVNYLPPKNNMNDNKKIIELMLNDLYANINTSPKPYIKGIEQELDNYLPANHLDGTISWWDIVAQLLQEGEIHLAKLAQSQAIPNLSDFKKVVDYYRDTHQSNLTFKNMSNSIGAFMQDFPQFAGQGKIYIDFFEKKINLFDLKSLPQKIHSTYEMLLYGFASYQLTNISAEESFDESVAPPFLKKYYQEFEYAAKKWLKLFTITPTDFNKIPYYSEYIHQLCDTSRKNQYCLTISVENLSKNSAIYASATTFFGLNKVHHHNITNRGYEMAIYGKKLVGDQSKIGCYAEFFTKKGKYERILYMPVSKNLEKKLLGTNI